MKSSGWVFTDAVNWVACPKCNQKAGGMCRQPSGRKRHAPHQERVGALANHPEYDVENYQLGSSKRSSIIAEAHPLT